MDTHPASRTLDLYRALWKYAEGARGAVFGAAALLIASQLVRLSLPWLAARAIDALQLGGVAAFGTAAQWVGAIFVATVAGWALHGPGRILERNVAIRVRRRLTDLLVGRLIDAPLGWHEQRHSGETIHRLDRSSGALYDFAQSQFVTLQNAVSVVGPIAALALLSPATGAAALVGYGLILWGVIGFDRTMMRLAADENAAHRRLQAAQVDTLGNVVSVLALRLGPATRERLRARLDALFVPLRRMIVLNEAKWCTVDLLGSALWCVLLGLYVWLAHRDAVPGAPLLLGGVFMVHQYAQQAGGVVASIAAHYQTFTRHRADYASALPILDAPRGVEPDRDAPADEPADWRRIVLHGLSFAHPARQDAGRPTLDALDLTIERGARIALVGESGSGKSSLLRVLAGLYTARVAQAAIDGRPVRLSAVARHATLIPQDAEVFEGTLRENLAMARPADLGDDTAALHAALHGACLDEWLATQPSGLDTALAERGGNLSGGQRQRIAFARGLLAARDSSLLLLDEVSSSLDARTEAEVFSRLFAVRPDAAIVASVHRLHLLGRFDEVWWLVDGRLADRGSAEAIARRHASFRRLLLAATREAPAPPQP